MQASTLVTLCVPIVALWISLVITFARSMKE